MGPVCAPIYRLIAALCSSSSRWNLSPCGPRRASMSRSRWISALVADLMFGAAFVAVPGAVVVSAEEVVPLLSRFAARARFVALRQTFVRRCHSSMLPLGSGKAETGDARSRDGGVREELAAGVVQLKPTTEVEQPASCPLNVKTARLWRGIVPFTHLAREGAYDCYHRTAGIAGCTRRGGGRGAPPGPRAAAPTEAPGS